MFDVRSNVHCNGYPILCKLPEKNPTSASLSTASGLEPTGL